MLKSIACNSGGKIKQTQEFCFFYHPSISSADDMTSECFDFILIFTECSRLSNIYMVHLKPSQKVLLNIQNFENILKITLECLINV